MSAVRLTLPYPISANRYWRTAVRAGHASTYVTKEAMDFKSQVRAIAFEAGVWKPLAGRVEIAVQLYPHRPIDFQARQRKLGPAWDDGVQCIDLDNANKVLLDSIRGLVIEDDRWVRKLSAQRMEPDEHGSRVVLWVRRMPLPVMQQDLVGAAV